ncbi:hypothetical protein JK208_07675 [Gluconobacter sp. Dm-74]|uniref:hypothetical protein n=1 Tax=Gluconobacter sp. Dm-74 TaxID=2799803 RepID=UPI001BC1EC4D|nr:hypothetical protein [Gluconobacter sp. Dm-74]MBS1091487.1 hypothetical protein [Gluconobacter sp. Dm-74]
MPHFPSFFAPLAKLSEYRNGKFIGGRGRKKPSYFAGATLLGFPGIAAKPPKERKKQGRPNEWPDCPRLFELARKHPDRSISFLLGLLWDENPNGGREKYIENRRSRLPPGVWEHVRIIQEIERAEREQK